MNARNMNRLSAVVNNQTRVAALTEHAEEYKAVLKYDLVKQVTQPLQVAKEFSEFLPYPGLLASLINKAFTAQRNALIAAFWRDTTPDAEKVNANAPKEDLQPFVTWTTDDDITDEQREAGAQSDDEILDTGVERTTYHDERTFEEIEGKCQLLMTATESISNIKGVKEVRWLKGTFKESVVVQGDGTVVRVTTPHIPKATRSMYEFVMDKMAHNQHREALWYTKQLYFKMSNVDYCHGFAHGLEIHEIKEQVAKHLEEEITVNDEVTTRLAMYIPAIANYKFAQWLENIKEGKSGSAEMNMWIAYSPDRMSFAERFLDSLELEEYLAAEEAALRVIQEREARMARFDRVKQGGASPAEKAQVQQEVAAEHGEPVVQVLPMIPHKSGIPNLAYRRTGTK